MDSKKFCLFFLVVSAMIFVLYGQTLGGPTHGKVVACYMSGWAVYRATPAKYTAEDVNPALCTHITYAFAGLSDDGSDIISVDAKRDFEDDNGKAGFKRVVALKNNYPHLKVTICVGGWKVGSLKFSKMTGEPETRQKFVQNVLTFLETYKFDGLDIAWEYPARRGGKPEDKANYVTLVKELKEAFKPRNYILTAVLSGNQGIENVKISYDLAGLSRYVDRIHLKLFNYRGTWDGFIGAIAPLRGTNKDDVYSVEYTIKYMLYHGVDPKKIVIGLVTSGTSFILKDPQTNVIEFGITPVKSESFDGPFTDEPGYFGYSEICMLIAKKSSNWAHHWDKQTSTPYIRDGDKVICYENARSFANKVKLAVDYGLSGVMVWNIDTDDFKSDCKGEPDIYLDFEQRYNLNLLADDNPVIEEASKIFKLPRVPSPTSHYTVSNGKLQLRLPERQYSNYNLLRTVNEAFTLALEEKRITDVLECTLKKVKITNEGVSFHIPLSDVTNWLLWPLC